MFQGEKVFGRHLPRNAGRRGETRCAACRFGSLAKPPQSVKAAMLRRHVLGGLDDAFFVLRFVNETKTSIALMLGVADIGTTGDRMRMRTERESGVKNPNPREFVISGVQRDEKFVSVCSGRCTNIARTLQYPFP